MAAVAMVGVALLGAATNVAQAQAVPSSSPAATTKPTSQTTTRDSGLYPFASSSPWNTAIGSNAVFEASTAPRTANLQTNATPVMNSASWSVTVAEATGTEASSSLLSVRNAQTYSLQVPSGTVATGGDDKEVTFVQANRTLAYDAYKATQSGSLTWTSQVAYPIDLTGSGIGKGIRAAAVPAVAGLIRSEEADANSINHALALSLPGSMLKVGYQWPASSQDSDTSGYKGQIPMGSLFAIPGTVDLSSLGLSPEGLALAKALQNYGVYVVDQSTTSALYAEQAVSAAKVTKLIAAWKTLYPYLRGVANNSSTSVGGGGTPRVAPLPPVG